MNPIFNMINKEAPDMLNQFLNFYRNFKGDPNKELDNIVNSGKYSKQEIEYAVKRAKQIENMIRPFLKKST